MRPELFRITMFWRKVRKWRGQGEEPGWGVLEAEEKTTVFYGDSFPTEIVENDMIKNNLLNWALRRLSMTRRDDEFLHTGSMRCEIKWWIKASFTGERKQMEEEESVKRGKEEKDLCKAICTNLY